MYLRGSQIYFDKGFVKKDNASQGGSHWMCFIIKENKSYHFDSFGSQPDKFLLNQLPKRLIYHNYKIQDINSKLCGSFVYTFTISIKE